MASGFRQRYTGVAIINVHFVQPPDVDLQTAPEIIAVARLLGGPSDFRQGAGARESHVFRLFQIWDLFRPQVALGAEDVRLQLRWQVRGHGFKGIHLVQGEGPPPQVAALGSATWLLD